MDVKKLLKKLSCPVLLVLVLGLGCHSFSDNNYLRPEEFADYLRAAGIQVKSVRKLPGEPFQATSGAAILIDNSEIGIYKFDVTSKSGRERLEQVKEHRCLYIKGLPFPVEVRGSFVLMGLEKHRKKRSILKVFDRFY